MLHYFKWAAHIWEPLVLAAQRAARQEHPIGGGRKVICVLTQIDLKGLVSLVVL